MATTDELTNKYLDKVEEAFTALSGIPFTPVYLHKLRADVTRAALEAADPGWEDRVHCYLMFFGGGQVATHMKIGVSNNPSFRLATICTGNPLEPLWAYSFPYPDRKTAMAAERRLHGKFAAQRTSGEWFKIQPASVADARAMANGAFRIASERNKPCGPLSRVEV